MTRLKVSMCALHDEGHDFDVEVEVNGSEEDALSAVKDALPNHVWYRWSNPETRANGRNQDAFPASEEDWDEDRKGRQFYELTGHPVEFDFGPPPLYRNPS